MKKYSKVPIATTGKGNEIFSSLAKPITQSVGASSRFVLMIFHKN